MVCTGNCDSIGGLPLEVDLATGISEALGGTEIPGERCGIVGAVVGAGDTIAEHGLSIRIAILGEQEPHHELLCW